jgi:hypothetical protein
MKKFLFSILPRVDFLFAPFVYLAAGLLRGVRRLGMDRMPISRRALLKAGVFPITDHYYEPQFDYRNSPRAFAGNRQLPGIDWNIAGQLVLLSGYSFTGELAGIAGDASTGPLKFHFNNGTFEAGDAEYWYQLIRALKPRRIFEVGSGNSTLMAVEAIRRNRAEDPGYTCRHVCIEPFEAPWLEERGATVLRMKIEELPLEFFSELAANDILFIDSTHIIRPGGDVLFEYLELLPALNTGVIVHVHDIFSPDNYPRAWLEQEVRFWNEQYLLEAFLSHNRDWKIIGALNYLHHHHYEHLKAVAPYLTPRHEPGSFYLQKIR